MAGKILKIGGGGSGSGSGDVTGPAGATDSNVVLYDGATGKLVKNSSLTTADLTALVDNSLADTLHRHSELVASDGSPDPALQVNAVGRVGIGGAPGAALHVMCSGAEVFIDNSSDTGRAGLTLKNSSAGGGQGEVQLYWYDSSYATADVRNKLRIYTENSEDIILDHVGNVGLGTTTPATSAKLDISSTTGALLLTRMTTTQKNSLTAVGGMLLYDSTLAHLQGRGDGAWKQLDYHADDTLTTTGDLLLRGATTSERLAGVARGANLTSMGAGVKPVWNKPMTTTGDLLVEDAAGYGVRLAAGTNGHILTANGAGVKPSWKVGGSTKEFFVPVTTTVTGRDCYAVATFDGVTGFCYMTFRVPGDFSSITNATIVTIPHNTRSNDWDIYSNYAQTGENRTTHAQQNTSTTYSTTANVVYEINIAGILTSLAANDIVGIKFYCAEQLDDVSILGIRFKYS